ncbi:MAG: sigma-70 family RNA polymerase sigma factor [Phycisphaerae bacterium]|nr:sigma-70 family RNA polymerase sigma factor [Phycisphaerae bacterium]
MDGASVGLGEVDLIRRCLQGDNDAFHSLYLAHAGRIKVYFKRSGFSPADADDLAQEAFTRAFRALGGFDAARGPFGAWLSAIARNVARRRWGRRANPDNLDPELAEEMLSIVDNPGHSIQTLEELDGLGQCRESLPGELADIIRLRYVTGLTTRGIAAETGLAEATVRLRLAHAIGLLQECMKAKGLLG